MVATFEDAGFNTLISELICALTSSIGVITSTIVSGVIVGAESLLSTSNNELGAGTGTTCIGVGLATGVVTTGAGVITETGVAIGAEMTGDGSEGTGVGLATGVGVTGAGNITTGAGVATGGIISGAGSTIIGVTTVVVSLIGVVTVDVSGIVALNVNSVDQVLVGRNW